MAACIQTAMCTICGTKVGGDYEGWKSYVNWNPQCWMSMGILMSGPHWWLFREAPVSIEIPDETVICERAYAVFERLEVYKVDQDNQVLIQCEVDANEDEHYGTDADCQWYLLVHSACLEIAKKVMQTSLRASIRGMGDLWMTLDQRCSKSWSTPGLHNDFPLLPLVPISRQGNLIKLGLGGYYISEYAMNDDPEASIGEWVSSKLPLCRIY